MKEVSIVGLDLAKRVFQVHAARSDAVLSCAESCHVAKSSRSLRNCPSARSQWRPEPRRITGRVRSASLATRFA